MSGDISADSNDGNIAAPSTELLTEQTPSSTVAEGGNVGAILWRNKFQSNHIVLIGVTLALISVNFLLEVGSFIRILNLFFIGFLFMLWSPFDYLIKQMKKASGHGSQLIVSFGEMLVDFVPDVAGLSLAESTCFIKAPGGAPANVACAIAKLGGNSAFIGKVGDDEFGHMLVDILKKHDVNVDGVRFDEDARTALAFVTLKTNGEREFTFYRNPSADMLLTESELNMGLIKQAKIFHYGSISLITDPCKSAHMTAMKTAKESRGVLLSYDPNVRLPLWPSADAARDAIMSIWDYADIIKVSDEEVAFLTERDASQDDVVMSLWHDQLKLLVVTDGEKGCRYYTKNFRGRLHGFSVKTVDSTGAGDAFVGSLLVSIAKEDDDTIFSDEGKLKEALTLANACGALSTTQKGAIPALPTIADAQALIINANTSNEDI